MWKTRRNNNVVVDVGPYGLWTTIVVSPDHKFDRPLRGFQYSIGCDIPGLVKVTACRSDTNLNVAGMLVDENMRVDSVTWQIPALALGKFQRSGKDYTVTEDEVHTLAAKATLIVHAEGPTPVHVQIPLSEGMRQDAVGNYGATHALDPVEVGRMRAFWVELVFDGAPTIKGTIPILITLDGLRERGVQ